MADERRLWRQHVFHPLFQFRVSLAPRHEPARAAPHYLGYGLNGMGVVDMAYGGVNNSVYEFLRFQKDGAYAHVGYIRSVFWVIGSQNGGGYLLGGGTNQYNSATHWNFHRGLRGTDSLTDTYGCTNYLAGGATHPDVKNANWYKNGEKVDPATTELSGRWDQLSMVMTRGNAESLFSKGVPAGRVTVIPSPWGVADTPQCPLPVRTVVGKPLDKPYPLLPETRRILDGVFRAQRIFSTSSEPATNGLSLVTCRRGKGDYTVCVMNNTWEPRPFALVACAGRITAKEELPTDVSERGQIGFAPNTVSNVVVGADTDDTIAAGAVRIFRVKTDEGGAVAEIPYRAPTPNAPRQTLFLRNLGGPIKEAVMRRPTFFRHYDSVMLDARYLVAHDRADLVRQTDWLKKQGLKVMVDASSLFNLFPDLRLVENDTNETARTSAAVGDLLDKMDALGARDLVIALHRRPENNITEEGSQAQMEGVLRRLCRQAAKKNITVYLRQSPNRCTGALSALPHWISGRVKEPNFKPAPSLAAQMLNEGGDVQKVAKSIEAFDSDLWLVAAPAKDMHGQLWSLHRPLAEQEILPDIQPLVDALKKKKVRLVYDAIYPDADAEYRDARLFER